MGLANCKDPCTKNPTARRSTIHERRGQPSRKKEFYSSPQGPFPVQVLKLPEKDISTYEKTFDREVKQSYLKRQHTKQVLHSRDTNFVPPLPLRLRLRLRLRSLFHTNIKRECLLPTVERSNPCNIAREHSEIVYTRILNAHWVPVDPSTRR